MPEPASNTDDADSLSLAEKIDAVRITYPERDPGVGIEGHPFTVRFDAPIDLEEFYETVFTAEDPWNMWGVYNELKEEDEDTDPYWSVAAVAFHVEGGEREGASKVDLEVCPEWMRVYVKGEDASAERIAEFVQTVCEHYDASIDGLDDLQAPTEAR